MSVAYWKIGLARRRIGSFDRAVDLRYMAGLDDQPIRGYDSTGKIVAEVPPVQASSRGRNEA